MFDPKRAEQLDRIEALLIGVHSMVLATMDVMNTGGKVMEDMHLAAMDSARDAGYVARVTTAYELAAQHEATEEELAKLGKKSAAPGPSVDQSDFTYCGCQHECFRAYGKSVGQAALHLHAGDVHAHVIEGRASSTPAAASPRARGWCSPRTARTRGASRCSSGSAPCRGWGWSLPRPRLPYRSTWLDVTLWRHRNRMTPDGSHDWGRRYFRVVVWRFSWGWLPLVRPRLGCHRRGRPGLAGCSGGGRCG